jgi:hypothetical protein
LHAAMQAATTACFPSSRRHCALEPLHDNHQAPATSRRP